VSNERSVHVDLADRGYDILIGSGVLAKLEAVLKPMHAAGARRAFVVVDSGVPQHFADQIATIAQSLGIKPTLAAITPTESIKSIQTYQSLLEHIASTGHSRVDPVIALGGGIVGDLAGFVAASYLRGVPVIQCPTTLLSMVDASVGGKTGFNLRVANTDGSDGLLKNLVGAFWQPKCVIADIDTLDSLDPRQRRSGLSECIKHGFISAGVGHDGLLDWMIQNTDAIASFNPATMSELVERNAALKASVVALDEREDTSKLGGRMLLNFGHTFGHAIETLDNLSPDPSDPALAPLHHGEAVALGMVAACRAAEHATGLDPAIGNELISILKQTGLPVQVAGLPSNQELVERMSHDKKATANTIQVVIPTSRGKCTVVKDAPVESLEAGFNAIRA